MVKKPIEGHVVDEFMIGNTKVKICDDYCRDKSPEYIQMTLKRIAANALAAFNAVEYSNTTVK